MSQAATTQNHQEIGLHAVLIEHVYMVSTATADHASSARESLSGGFILRSGSLPSTLVMSGIYSAFVSNPERQIEIRIMRYLGSILSVFFS